MTTDLATLPPVIDPHVHQWDPFTSPRVISGAAKILRVAPFLERVVHGVFPRRDLEFIGDPRHVLGRYEVADYRADAGPLEVEAIVHIEAGWHGRGRLAPVDETRWITTLPFGVGGAPRLGGIVVFADLRDPRVEESLDAHLAASPLVRGVRQMGAFHPDPHVRNWAPVPSLYADRDFLRGFAHLAKRKMSFELWCYGHQLAEARALAEAFPETTFVLDHYATPVGVLGPRGRDTGQDAAARASILARWRDDLAALAASPNVCAKHSGLGMPLLGHVDQRGDEPPNGSRRRDALAPLITHLEACFGPTRTLWASNFPIDKPTQTLPESLRLLLDVLGAGADLARLTRDNARRVYRIDER
jgi:L-fuconolactonase